MGFDPITYAIAGAVIGGITGGARGAVLGGLGGYFGSQFFGAGEALGFESAGSLIGAEEAAAIKAIGGEVTSFGAVEASGIGIRDVFSAAGAVSQAGGFVQQQQASGDIADNQGRISRALNRQFDIDRRRQDIAGARMRRNIIRQQRVSYAAGINTAANTAAPFSSSAVTGASGVVAQTAGNLNYFDQTAELNTRTTATNRDIGGAQAEIGEAQGDYATGTAFATLGQTLFNASGGYRTVFGGNRGS